MLPSLAELTLDIGTHVAIDDPWYKQSAPDVTNLGEEELKNTLRKAAEEIVYRKETFQRIADGFDTASTELAEGGSIKGGVLYGSQFQVCRTSGSLGIFPVTEDYQQIDVQCRLVQTKEDVYKVYLHAQVFSCGEEKYSGEELSSGEFDFRPAIQLLAEYPDVFYPEDMMLYIPFSTIEQVKNGRLLLIPFMLMTGFLDETEVKDVTDERLMGLVLKYKTTGFYDLPPRSWLGTLEREVNPITLRTKNQRKNLSFLWKYVVHYITANVVLMLSALAHNGHGVIHKYLARPAYADSGDYAGEKGDANYVKKSKRLRGEGADVSRVY